LNLETCYGYGRREKSHVTVFPRWRRDLKTMLGESGEKVKENSQFYENLTVSISKFYLYPLIIVKTSKL
jgi:hypothetical protein